MTKRACSATLLCGAALCAGVFHESVGAQAAQAGRDAARQPVYFLLYSRYSDHAVPQIAEERWNRLLPVMKQLKAEAPSASVLLQFSGAMMEPLQVMDSAGGHIGRLKDMVRQGLAEFGYDGKDEPTYRNRPVVKLGELPDPRQRWLARGEAEDVFLRYHRAPYTGEVDKSKPGGLKLVQDTLGDLAEISHWTQFVNNDAPELHWLDRLNQTAVLAGFPVSNPEWGLEGYKTATDVISRTLAASPSSAPEVYWESNRLRIAETSQRGTAPVSTTDGIDKMKKYLEQLDRSRPHVIQMEIAGEDRYLTLRSDGSVEWPPLVWAYDHPDHHIQPVTLEAFRARIEVDKQYQTEQETLQWLVKEFFSANPGSRFVSVADLKKAADNPVGSEIPAAEIKEAAESLAKANSAQSAYTGNWAEARGRYFSTAEMFQLLANSLAGIESGGKAPASVKLESMFGPLTLDTSFGGKPVEVDAASVIKAAAEIAPTLKSEAWKPEPSNMPPSTITVEGQKLNAGRFLNLMTQVYLGAKGKVTAPPCTSFTPIGGAYMSDTPIVDRGNTWTIKPSPLKLQ